MTETSPTTPRILGSLREENGRGVVHLEDVYPTDIDDLWSAVSEPERLKRWLVEVSGDTSAGQTFAARFTSGWDGRLRVDVCDAPHNLLVTAFDDEYSTETVMEATLTPEGAGTRLVIEERGLPLDYYADHGSGWQAHFEDLAAYLAGDEASDWEARWKSLTPSYRKMVAP
jgi:uncharacterized protein YndB with AHSA1/START domain